MALHRILMATAIAGALAFSSSAARAANLSADDQNFIRSSAEKGKHEVEIAKMAVQRTSNPQVKTFAQRLVDDHTKINQDLEAEAA